MKKQNGHLSRADCQHQRPWPCPLRQELRHLPSKKRCTKSKAGRTIVVHDNSAILACPPLASTAEFQETYRQKRPMIERTIAWLVRGQNRRLRYIRNREEQDLARHRAAAVNLMRMLTSASATTARHGWLPRPSSQRRGTPLRTKRTAQERRESLFPRLRPNLSRPLPTGSGERSS